MEDIMQSTLTEKNIKKSLKIQLIILFALNFFDLLATCAWIYFFGLEIEGNPIARMMFANDSVVLYKSAIIMCAEWILYICIHHISNNTRQIILILQILISFPIPK